MARMPRPSVVRSHLSAIHRPDCHVACIVAFKSVVAIFYQPLNQILFVSDTYFSVSGRSVTAGIVKARQLVRIQRHRGDCRRRRRALAGRRRYAKPFKIREGEVHCAENEIIFVFI